ncbi:MAG: NADPH-dependent FMN reductase [Candidatus Acidiferrales bacterium]
MVETLHILGIAGSLRARSYNRAVLCAAARMAPAGSAVDIADIGGIPLFNQDQEKQMPPVVTDFKKRIREAYAILIATPNIATRFRVCPTASPPDFRRLKNASHQ